MEAERKWMEQLFDVDLDLVVRACVNHDHVMHVVSG